jgi:hypothetical protein
MGGIAGLDPGGSHGRYRREESPPEWGGNSAPGLGSSSASSSPATHPTEAIAVPNLLSRYSFASCSLSVRTLTVPALKVRIRGTEGEGDRTIFSNEVKAAALKPI